MWRINNILTEKEEAIDRLPHRVRTWRAFSDSQRRVAIPNATSAKGLSIEANGCAADDHVVGKSLQ